MIAEGRVFQENDFNKDNQLAGLTASEIFKTNNLFDRNSFKYLLTHQNEENNEYV